MQSIRLLNALSYEYSHFMFFTLCPNTFDRHLYIHSMYITYMYYISWSPLPGGGRGRPPPRFWKKIFQYIPPPPDFGGFSGEKFYLIIKVLELREWESIVEKNFKFSLKFFKFIDEYIFAECPSRTEILTTPLQYSTLEEFMYDILSDVPPEPKSWRRPCEIDIDEIDMSI